MHVDGVGARMKKHPADSTADTGVTTIRRTTTSQNGAGVVSTKRRRSPIPDRDPTIRRWVSEMLPTPGDEATAADSAALIRWCRGFRTWRRLDERLEETGVAKADGDPTKWLKSGGRSRRRWRGWKGN